MTTALDIIKRAMRHIGALAEGETPTAQEEADGLDAFNDVLETWNLESLSVYGEAPEAFTTVGGQALYTIGTGGNFNTARPVDVMGAYVTYQGVDFPLTKIPLASYNDIGLKTQGNIIPEAFTYINDFPLGKIYLWPVPSQAMTISINAQRILSSVATGATVVSMPPGYKRALQYAVAVEMSAEYSTGVDVSGMARSTKAPLKRANRVQPLARYDGMLMADSYTDPRWN